MRSLQRREHVGPQPRGTCSFLHSRQSVQEEGRTVDGRHAECREFATDRPEALGATRIGDGARRESAVPRELEAARGSGPGCWWNVGCRRVTHTHHHRPFEREAAPQHAVLTRVQAVRRAGDDRPRSTGVDREFVHEQIRSQPLAGCRPGLAGVVAPLHGSHGAAVDSHCQRRMLEQRGADAGRSGYSSPVHAVVYGSPESLVVGGKPEPSRLRSILMQSSRHAAGADATEVQVRVAADEYACIGGDPNRIGILSVDQHIAAVAVRGGRLVLRPSAPRSGDVLAEEQPPRRRGEHAAWVAGVDADPQDVAELDPAGQPPVLPSVSADEHTDVGRGEEPPSAVRGGHVVGR